MKSRSLERLYRVSRWLISRAKTLEQLERVRLFIFARGKKGV